MIKDGNFTVEELDAYLFAPCEYNGVQYNSVQEFKNELTAFCEMSGQYANRLSHRADSGQFSTAANAGTTGGAKKKSGKFQNQFAGTPIPLGFERSGEYPIRMQVQLLSDFKNKKNLSQFNKEQKARNSILATSDKNIKKYYKKLKALENKKHLKIYETTKEKIQLWNNRANEANQTYGLSKYNDDIEVKKIIINDIIFEGHKLNF